MTIEMKVFALVLFIFVALLLILARVLGYFDLLWMLFWPQILLVAGGSLAFFLISQTVDTK
jgi:hypothetical protein